MLVVYVIFPGKTGVNVKNHRPTGVRTALDTVGGQIIDVIFSQIWTHKMYVQHYLGGLVLLFLNSTHQMYVYKMLVVKYYVDQLMLVYKYQLFSHKSSTHWCTYRLLGPNASARVTYMSRQLVNLVMNTIFPPKQQLLGPITSARVTYIECCTNTSRST